MKVMGKLHDLQLQSLRGNYKKHKENKSDNVNGRVMQRESLQSLWSKRENLSRWRPRHDERGVGRDASKTGEREVFGIMSHACCTHCITCAQIDNYDLGDSRMFLLPQRAKYYAIGSQLMTIGILILGIWVCELVRYLALGLLVQLPNYSRHDSTANLAINLTLNDES